MFNAQTPHALKGGVSQAVIDAMAKGERPTFDKPDEAALYDYGLEVFERRAISDATYARALELFGVPGLVEVTALIGYYGMVAMTLIAHGMPLPEGTAPPLVKKNRA